MTKYIGYTEYLLVNGYKYFSFKVNCHDMVFLEAGAFTDQRRTLLYHSAFFSILDY